jgi:hypothetical protein
MMTLAMVLGELDVDVRMCLAPDAEFAVLAGTRGGAPAVRVVGAASW